MRSPSSRRRPALPVASPLASRLASRLAFRLTRLVVPVATSLGVVTLGACASLPFFGGGTHFWGFVAPWDARSTASAQEHARQLDAVITGWVAFDTVTTRPYPLYRDSLRERVATATRTMVLVTTAIGGTFHPDVVRTLASNDSLLSSAAGAIASYAAGADYHGVVLDLEGMHASDLPLLVRVVRAIGDSARGRGVSPVVLAVPATDTAGYPGAPFIGPADLLLVMLYDEHWLTSPPGPIASPDWVQRNLAVRVSEVGASRLVAGFPLYGYRWNPGPPADVLTYPEAVRITTASGDTLARDPASLTLTAVDPGQWVIWTSDAVLLQALVGRARDMGVKTVALWRLGQEDPGVWSSVVK